MHLDLPKPKIYLENTLLVLCEYILLDQMYPSFLRYVSKNKRNLKTATTTQMYLGVSGRSENR